MLGNNHEGIRQLNDTLAEFYEVTLADLVEFARSRDLSWDDLIVAYAGDPYLPCYLEWD